MLWKGRRQSINVRDLRTSTGGDMAGKVITLDFERINKTFQEAVPEFKMKLDAKAEKRLHPETANALAVVQQDAVAKGFLGIPGTGVIDASILNVCAAWPKIRGMINFGLKMVGLFGGYKAEIALVKGFLTMTDTEIMPQLCGPPK